jgi:hypothetical protein
MCRNRKRRIRVRLLDCSIVEAWIDEQLEEINKAYTEVPWYVAGWDNSKIKRLALENRQIMLIRLQDAIKKGKFDMQQKARE